MPLSAVGAAVFGVQLANRSLGSLVLSLNGCYESGLYFLDLVEFLNATSARRRPALAPAPPEVSHFEVDNISFSYPGGSSAAVRGVSLNVRRGEMIALVGENGSGKSTVAKLLAALYDPDQGQIRWDGEPVTEARREELWNQVGFIAQDFTRWPFSARDNITMGKPVDLGSLRLASSRAGADVVIESLDAGYDTLLDRRFKSGLELSKGQWQRMAAARAFYRDCALLICDEPTAALDARGEQAFLHALREYAREKAVVLITHRLENVRHCDRAYVLVHGRVTESGGHDELMSLRGAFYELYQLQADRWAAVP
ncbi:hypothetical protein GCM10012289_14630 [Nonomuraea cavernae]|uniref:ABC transporter domain-containing protein n=1 Tax=Nonomuraea cavernae TaxID=2045107 RepID=A0A918DFX2_9ACTN|nr:hypothetical protein GCM10012289_14630 [Nonomuraea cavernae]